MIIFNVLCTIAIWNMFAAIINKQKTTNKLYCGIVGFSGKTNFDMNKITTLLLMNAYQRGPDSTGIFSPKNQLVKTTDFASTFLIKHQLVPDKMLMAHVRAATVGAKLEKNAHPFQHGNITLLHNGTLKNHWPLMRKHDFKWNDFDVDSQVISAIINKEQNFDVIKEIDGAAAFLINNSDKPDTLYAFRNKERPLYKGTINGCMYISSLAESLLLIGAKNIKEFEEDTLYRIENGIIMSRIKIKNTPYVEPINNSNAYGGHTEFHPLSSYVNTWLMLKYKPVGASYKWMQEFESYLVEDYSTKDVSFIISDEQGVKYEISKFNFYFEDAVITKDKYVMCNTILTIGTGAKERVVAKEGDVLFVKLDHYNGNASCVHTETKEEFNVPKDLLSRLSPIHERDFLIRLSEEKINKELIKDPKESIGFNNTGSFPDINDEIDTDTPNDNIEEEDEENIIEIDANQLLNELADIDDAVDNMYHTGMKNLPMEFRDEFRNNYNNVSVKLATCQYNYDLETNENLN